MDHPFDAASTEGRPRVLLVDDDDEVREALCEVLRAEGYEVATSAHGAEALSRLRAGPPPALILLDIDMPVMDGWAFYQAYRRNARLAGIPIVMLSAHGGATRDAPYVGVSALLAKPVNTAALLVTIERALSPHSDSMVA